MDQFRRRVRDNSGSLWLGGLGVLVIALIFLSLGFGGAGLTPEEFQPTLDLISTQTNAYVPTLAYSLTQTPNAALLTEAAPTLALGGRKEITQYAASAIATSQRSEAVGSALQAVGHPNAENCVNSEDAWSSFLFNERASLTLFFPELITPTGLLIHQNFNPGYIIQVAMTDVFGELHIIYQGEARPIGECSFILVIAIKDADFETNTVVITVDQAGSSNQSQVDAVQMIGVGR